MTYDSCGSFSDGCHITTFGGNARGAPCVFPFFYKGNRYTQCIYVNHDQLWCATSTFYDIDRRWGNCGGKHLALKYSICFIHYIVKVTLH